MNAPPLLIRWGYKGYWFVSEVIDDRCPKCGVRAVVALPPSILAEQLDDTTHVCHPLGGGCNHGFALDERTPQKTSGEAPSRDGSAERARAQSEPAGPPRETAGIDSLRVEDRKEYSSFQYADRKGETPEPHATSRLADPVATSAPFGERGSETVPAGECRCECHACESFDQHHGPEGNCQIDPSESARGVSDPGPMKANALWSVPDADERAAYDRVQAHTHTADDLLVVALFETRACLDALPWQAPQIDWHHASNCALRAYGFLRRLAEQRRQKPSLALNNLYEENKTLRAELAELQQRDAWKAQDDKPLAEDEAIHAAYPTRSGRDDLYGEAMRMVSARYSKGGLIALVNWLLHEREPLVELRAAIESVRGERDAAQAHANAAIEADMKGRARARELRRALRDFVVDSTPCEGGPSLCEDCRVCRAKKALG